MINYHVPLLVEGKQDLWHNLDKFCGSSEIGSIDDLYLIHLVQPEMADNGVRDATTNPSPTQFGTHCQSWSSSQILCQVR